MVIETIVKKLIKNYTFSILRLFKFPIKKRGSFAKTQW